MSRIHLELVDKFCYLGDVLSVDGDANMNISLVMRGRLYCTAVVCEVVCCMEVIPGL